MRIHTLQHVAFEGPGSIEDWAVEKGHAVRGTRLFAGEGLPDLSEFEWLVVMGGPMNVDQEDRHPWLAAEKRFVARAIEAGKVVLGVCLGAQLIARALGARVFPSGRKEIGWFPVEMTAAGRKHPLLRALPETFEAFHWHGDTFDLPAGALHVARSAASENQAFLYRDRVVGLQFHLEITAAGAGRLAEACADELVPAPFVQDAARMLADPRRFDALNARMRSLLDALAENQASSPGISGAGV